MSRLEAHIAAYDVMDTVFWNVRVWDTEGRDPGVQEPDYVLTGSMPGRGEDNPTRWLRELLECMREAQ